MTTTEVQAQSRQRREAITTLRASAPLALTRGDWMRSLLVFVAAVLTLLLADVALLWLHPGEYYIPVGNYRDKVFLQRVNYQETASDGTTYRWTTADSTLRLNQIGVARHAWLRLDLGGRPQADDVRLTLNDAPWAGFSATTQPRQYTLLLPPNPANELAVGIHSPTFRVPGDARRLGIKLEGFAVVLARDSLPFPTMPQFLWQIALILAAQLTAVRLGWRRPALLGLGLGLALALAALLSGALLLTYSYLPRLAVAGGALAALTWLGLPLAERRLLWAGDAREIRLLWALMLGACAIRLVGVLYPTFAGQDLGLNLGRWIKTVTGQMIVIAPSSEFANGLTIYPPGPYLAALPGATLFPDRGSLLQGVLAVLDGATAFLVALLARRLGGNRDAARFGLLLYAGSTTAFAALEFGFAAQIFGQWFTTPLALLLMASSAPPRPRAWLLAALLLLLGIFSHVGVAILGVTWMVITLLLMLPRDRRGALWGMALMTAGGLLALGLLYIDIAAITLNHATSTVTQRGTGGLPGATPLLFKGARLAYTDIGLATLPLGLLLIARARAGGGWLAVPLAWLLTTLLFFVVDLLLAVQVRYFYFALPLALSAIAIVLGRLAARGRWARFAVWALVLMLFLQGVMFWYSSAFGDGQLSMTPLTH